MSSSDLQSHLEDSKKFIENEEKIIENDVNEPEMDVDNDKISSDLIENEKNSTDVENEEEKSVEPEWVDILGSGVIMKKILLEGTPDTKPRRGQRCILNYVLRLEDDTEVETRQNFEIQLGECDVIQGLDVTIGLMNVQEKCILKIQPRLGFGAKGLPPNIPGGSTVVYEVELASVHDDEDVETIPLQERRRLGNKKRERGNWWYQRGENNLAIQCYRRALDYLDEVEGGISGPLSENNGIKEASDADLQALLEDRISVYNNMAAAQIKMELYDAALLGLQTVLRCQPDNVKALFRKAKIYMAKNDMNAALKHLEKAKDLQPSDAIIQKEINTVNALMAKQKNSEREYARRMFGGSKADPKNNDSNQKPKSKFHVWATLGASFVVGLAGLIAYKSKYP